MHGLPWSLPFLFDFKEGAFKLLIDLCFDLKSSLICCRHEGLHHSMRMHALQLWRCQATNLIKRATALLSNAKIYTSDARIAMNLFTRRLRSLIV